MNKTTSQLIDLIEDLMNEIYYSITPPCYYGSEETTIDGKGLVDGLNKLQERLTKIKSEADESSG